MKVERGNSLVNRLALGTAQFGFPYGIANTSGQINAEEARTILECAENAGIDMLDTAIAYGESEMCLGMAGVSRWKVVSKLPAIPDDCCDVESWVLKSVESSLKRLRLSRLHGLLLHRPVQLLGDAGQALYGALINLKEQGFVEKTGISIYDPVELDTLTERFDFDIVQAPFNILDNRMIETGWMERLSKQGIEIHARSVFLQGLLLMSNNERPEKFKRWQSIWDRWQEWLEYSGCTPLQACLRYVLAQKQIDRVIIGVDSLKQFNEIIVAADEDGFDVPRQFCCTDLDLINPARWSAIQ